MRAAAVGSTVAMRTVAMGTVAMGSVTLMTFMAAMAIMIAMTA